MSLHVFKKGIFGILIDVREVSLHEDIQFKMPWKKLIKQDTNKRYLNNLTLLWLYFDRQGEYPIMDIDFKFDFTLCRFDVSVNLFTLWGDSTVDLKNL